ncbi:iron-sulfur cluster repair di-iron protein [Altibacter sp.]|uniref:iron-sulfur cluster repair di-iron protein n=1 Tax=Altibacter sp. TaxID=2024823 RepID=UPI000C95DBF5|nr:iron-sulfur cluster repair di-iron protein [Altibacter sp.]MAP55063.1 iron-sulfur cluster repair di-iron protein [Altibacter sp.]|tara:strand:- start:57 stop:779 length:723 start_codon:yes stop_codon:yes gene_type:complete
MTITKDKTVAEIVTENIKASHVFKKYNIDFCCGGGVTIEKACEKKGIAYETLKNDLLHLDSSVEDSNDYNNWKLPFLIDYIVNIHHQYVEENLPLLLMYASKVAKVHGHHYSEVIEIDRLVREIASELAAHMKKEELILFPFIKQMVRAEKEGTPLPNRNFGTVDNPIKMMEHEHEEVGQLFREIAQLTNEYTPPSGACNTFKALYDKLNEFEQDLHTHIHLENNILHPKALQLEQRLQS